MKDKREYPGPAATGTRAQIKQFNRPQKNQKNITTNKVTNSENKNPKFSTEQQHKDADPKPVIFIKQGNLDDLVRQAAGVLQAASAGIYQWGGRLVRQAQPEAPSRNSPIQRDPAMRMLVPLTPGWIALRLSEAANLQRWDVRAKEYRPTDPPPRLATTILDAGDELGFPILRARAGCPQLLADGRIQMDGYDPDTQLLVDAPGEWPAPPKSPSRQDAEQALDRLRHLFRHYPWATSEAEATAIAALTTACIRPMLAAAPVFGITAPSSGAGTGKSLLVRSISLVTTGRSPAVINWPNIPGEGAKRLDSAHLSGDLIISIDNITGQIEDAALCTSLTEPVRSIRELGASRIISAPMHATHFLTGNGLHAHVRGDLTRRMVMVELDPKTDAPDQRDIPQRLDEECRARRGEIRRDVYTILLAYSAAGEPDMELSPMGNFHDWTRRVRSPLVWLGLPDPALTQAALRADDPRRDERAALFRAWHEAFGGGSADGATVREACNLVCEINTYHQLPRETVEQLRDAIEAVATRRGKICALALGSWLRSARGARVGDLVLQSRSARGGTKRWVILRDDAPPGGCGGVCSYYLREKCQIENDKIKSRAKGLPHHNHLNNALARAVEGLAVTPEQLHAALSPEDREGISSGAIGVETLRGFAVELLRQKGGS